MAPAKKTADPQAEKDAEIVRLRDEEGLHWDVVAERVSMGTGNTMLRYLIATTKPADRIKPAVLNDETALAKTIAELRDKQHLSWGVIAARTGGTVPEGRVRRLYEDATGKAAAGQRIGKGGRPPGSGVVADSKPKAAKAAKATKAPAKKAAGKAAPAASGTTKLFSEMTEKELTKRLSGTTIVVQKGANKQVRMVVSKITGLDDDGTVTFLNGDGEERTVEIGQIKKATQPKVAA